MRGWTRWRAVGAAALCGAALSAVAASGHIVYGAKTLRQLTAEADVVLRARIVASGERVGISTEQGGVTRPIVEAAVLETLKGDPGAPTVRFAQHGHGVATFRPGEEALVFLQRIARTRELAALGGAGVVEWVSLQEHEEAFPLQPATRDALLGAARRYVAAESAPAEARLPALREATLGLLTSGDADLAASAIRDLVAAPDVALVTEAEVATLSSLLADANLSMGVRVALLAELERRGLVDGKRFWLHWLSDATPPRDRVRALQAQALATDPAVRERVVALLADPDPAVAAAAAAALGTDPREASIAALAKALQRPEENVRYASIRALGQLATPAARDALAAAADAHPDAATRRRARAELRKPSRATGD